MSHFDEMTCMQYLDGQLDRARAAELAAHADSCGPCRRLLGILERESQLLQSALVEEDEAVPARVLSPPFAEKASWAWITAFGLAASGAYFFWVEMVSPWLANLSQAGFGEGNLLTLLFFGGVFWKGWGDMLNLVQMLATGTLVILGIGLLMRVGRRLTTVTMVLATLLMVFLMPSVASAAEIRKKESVVIPAGETVSNDLIATGATVRIDGTVDGDLIVFCESLTLNGRVTGDLLGFARSLRVEGTVDGDIRAFSNNFTLSGSVKHNLTSFTQQFELGSKSDVGGGLILFTEFGTLDGRIGRDVMAFSDRSLVNGRVGGDIRIKSGSLTFGSTSEVLGKIAYNGRKEAVVDPGAKLANPVEYEKWERRPDYASLRFYWRQALRWGAAFVLGLVLILLFPGFFRQTVKSGDRPGGSILAGVTAFVGLFVIAIVGCITLVGMGVGLITLAFWAALFYAAQVFFGAWLGSRIFGDRKVMLGAVRDGSPIGMSESTSGLLARLAVGLLVIRIVGNLPFFIGPLAWLVVECLGMGFFILAAFEGIRRRPSIPPPAPAPATAV